MADEPVAPAAPVAPAPVVAPSWRDSLPDDLKADKSLESFKDVGALAKSYVETKRLVGAKAEFKVPDANSTPEERAAYRKAIGVPDTPEAYQIKPHAMMTHPEWNKEAHQSFLKLFHEEGVPTKAAERILHAYGDFVAGQVKANDVMAAEARAELKVEWGANHDAFMGLANHGAARVAKELGVEPGDIFEATKGSDPALVAKMFHWMESQFTEHGWVTGAPIQGLSREEAEAKLVQLNEQLLKLDPNSERASELVNEVVKYRQAAMRAA